MFCFLFVSLCLVRFDMFLGVCAGAHLVKSVLLFFGMTQILVRVCWSLGIPFTGLVGPALDRVYVILVALFCSVFLQGCYCYLLCEDFLIDCSMSLVENNRSICLSYEFVLV
ncbi:hypothetical protein Hanom_Chr01g00050801 [Helianthus anomalus]